MAIDLFKLGTLALGGYVVYKLKVLDKQRKIDAEDIKNLYAELDKVYVHKDAESAVMDETMDFLEKFPANFKKLKDDVLKMSVTPEKVDENLGSPKEENSYEEQFNDDIDKGFEVPTEPGFNEEEHPVDSEIPSEPGFEGNEDED